MHAMPGMVLSTLYDKAPPNSTWQPLLILILRWESSKRWGNLSNVLEAENSGRMPQYPGFSQRYKGLCYEHGDPIVSWTALCAFVSFWGFVGLPEVGIQKPGQELKRKL
jgi:hypothetical protein